MNILNVSLPDLAALDEHLDGRLRRTLYELVGAGHEPGIDVIRERDDGRVRWFLIVRGADPQGVVRREERFEIQLGGTFEKVIGIAAKIHVRSYLNDLRQELSVIYAEEFAPEEDDQMEPWFSSRCRGRAS